MLQTLVASMRGMMRLQSSVARVILIAMVVSPRYASARPDQGARERKIVREIADLHRDAVEWGQQEHAEALSSDLKHVHAGLARASQLLRAKDLAGVSRALTLVRVRLELIGELHKLAKLRAKLALIKRERKQIDQRNAEARQLLRDKATELEALKTMQ